MSFLATPLSRHGKERSHRAVISGGASVAIAIGGIALFSWLSHTDWRWLLSITFLMKFNIALALVASGAGLVAILRHGERYAVALGIFLLALGISTFIEHLTGIDLAIDEFLLTIIDMRQRPFPDGCLPTRR